MNDKQIRSLGSKFTTRNDNGTMKIEGYFAVFNETYNIADGLSESIEFGAFTDALQDDVRALIDHDTRLVLGRTTANTLELREDEHGLWGSITVNPKDQDAVNLYARVERGDVTQCSIGFDILSQRYDALGGGSVHWFIERVKLYEVSVCTFPAYETTNVEARSAERDEIVKRQKEAWRLDMLTKVKGE